MAKKKKRCKTCAKFHAKAQKRERQISDAFTYMMMWMGVDPYTAVDLDMVLTVDPESDTYSRTLAEEAHREWVHLNKKYQSEFDAYWYGHMKNERREAA